MPLYKIDITIPFTIEAAGKINIDFMVRKIKWKSIFTRLKLLGLVPRSMKFRENLMSKAKVTKIEEIGIS